MAAMSVIGIDLGNESCYVAVAKAGGIETIANDYSLRATPSFIAFSDKNRILGVAAKSQQITNMKNTVYGLKRLIGRKYRDPHVQRELQMLPFNVIEVAQGNIGIKVNYLNEEHIFSPEQCLAMLLTKLKDISSTALQTPINDCVISVPSYFTNNERKALMDSAAIAGLNVLRLFNETTATALSYGIYKQDLPGPDDKSRNVVFVDCGHSSLQVFACAFNKDKLRMIATASDAYLGGRDFDLALADHFCKEFQTKYHIDAKSNPRAFSRLLGEVEKVKKQMSANSTSLPLNIECFMDDKDVHSSIKRTDMEQLCAPLFQRVETTLKQCLDASGLKLDEIYSVEIVGGSSRIPAIKQLIEKVFKKVPSTTLNQDEAVSRGCALQCAMLSPAVRVREFNVKDVQNYAISVSWDASTDGEAAGEVEAFPVNHQVPYSKMLTFYRQEPFSIKAMYSGNVPYPDKHIGTWIVKEIRPNAEGKPQKVKVKVRINLHGIMTVSSASLFEAKESSEAENDETQKMQQEEQEKPASQNSTNQQNDVDAPMADGVNNAAPEVGSSTSWTKKISAWFSGDGDKDKKKKQVLKSIELPIESLTAGFSQVEINQYTEQEFKMIAADRQEKERADARNAFEEYVYELRGKLSSDDEYGAFILENDRSVLMQQLDDMENWLYEDGAECNRQVYQDKLAELKSKGEPIQTRKVEFELRPHVIEDFAKSLQLTMKALEAIKGNDPKFAHLTEDDVKKVDNAFKNSFQWLEQTRAKLVNAPKHLAPPVTVSQIRQEKNDFESTVSPILNKPPPKAPSPPKEEKSPTDETTQNAQTDQNQQNQQNQNQQENMDWSSAN
ncbi:heat shock 70 kDa protein 4 isoform X1 [Tribolium madens]|uniref:heat shock 70 kDa protein 4 isoform X1 n=1 Tax=Tribolium madens TaxID=41895 RepID=UPI001CF75299|nr:heat shock 70 kDa protein 4 isoform X1 [Tribolium madens]